MEGLGRLFDIGTGFAPVDINTNNGETGKRCSLQSASGVSIVVFKAAGTAGDDPTLTLKEHNAYTGGTSQNLAVIDHYYTKSETALDNDEPWVKVTQTAAATITGTDVILGESQYIIVIPVQAYQLSDGFTHISLDYAVAALANAQLATWMYILHGLTKERTPANLPNLLHPGAANA